MILLSIHYSVFHVYNKYTRQKSSMTHRLRNRTLLDYKDYKNT